MSERVMLDLQDGSSVVHKTARHDIKAVDDQPIVRLISTATVDYDGDIIHQVPSDKGRGWVLDRYNKRGGMVFFGHNTWEMPLGKGEAFVDALPDGGHGLFHRDEFDAADPDAVRLEGKVRGGFITESSVGCIYRIKEARDGVPFGVEVFEAELLEASYVNWGANPDTEVLAKMLGRHADVAAKVQVSDAADAEQWRKEIAERVAVVERLVGDLFDEKEVKEASDGMQSAIDKMVSLLRSAGLVKEG